MPSSAFSVQRQPPVIPGITVVTASPGVPASGASGSVLTKQSATDYDTAWLTRANLAADTAFTDKFGLQGAGAPGGTGISGQEYWDTTNKRKYLSDGTGWIITAEQTQTFATVVTSITGTITTLGTVTMTYRRNDGWLSWNLSITITTNGTGASGIRFTLPVNASAVWAGCGREVILTGSALSVTGATTNADILTYNNAYPGGSTAQMVCSGQYQMTTRYS